MPNKSAQPLITHNRNGANRLTRFFITLFLALAITIKLSGINLWLAQPANSQSIGPCLSPSAPFNSVPYATNSVSLPNPTPPSTNQLQGSLPLTFYGGTLTFNATFSRNSGSTPIPGWSNGVQVQNYTNDSPDLGDFLFLQPNNLSNYRNADNQVRYTLTFSQPVSNFSMTVGGLNNFDGTTVRALNGSTEVILNDSNFTNLSGVILDPNEATNRIGRESIFDGATNTPGGFTGYTIISGNPTTGGASADTNTYLITIPQTITELIIVSGKSSTSNGTVTIGFTTFNSCRSISGTVFNDINGSGVQNGGEVGTNAGGLNAVLVNSSNQVLAVRPVASNGTYLFNNVQENSDYTVRITTANPTIGSSPPPAVTLPANWVNTGENLNGVTDGTIDGIISVSVTTNNVPNVNLGIEQRPTAVGGTAASQVNPGGTNTVTAPTSLFTGSTDPDGGTVVEYQFTAFPSNTTSITINSINYTSATFPSGGVTVTTAQLAGLLVDPIDGAVTVAIPFRAIDNAGQLSSNTANASLPFTAPVANPPNVLLVKRITALNGSTANLTSFIDETSGANAADDNNLLWPSGYLIGGGTSNPADPFVTNTLRVRPGDILDYTIYYLNAGLDPAPANLVRICDRLDPQLEFVPTSFNANSPADGGLPSDKGIALAVGSTTPTFYLTNINDPPDRGEFVNASIVPPNCNTSDNPNGTVVVNVTRTTGSPTLPQIPNATGAGTPANSYGFVRFRARVR